MTRKRFLVLSLVLASGLLSLALVSRFFPRALPRTDPPRARHVFIVSLDGGRPDVIRNSDMPALKTLMSQGAVTWNARTVSPSVTLVAHTSMLTGLTPSRHRIDWNGWRPEKGLVTVPTVFALAKARGYGTAMFVSDDKFQHLLAAGSVDDFALRLGGARDVARDAARCILAKKPGLCFIHFADADHAGHEHGWGSPEQRQALHEDDAALERVLDAIRRGGLARDSLIIVTSDHGGHDHTHGTDSPQDMTIPWIASGSGVRAGVTLDADVSTCDTAATALWVLGVPLPSGLDGRPVSVAFTPLPVAEGR